MSETFDTTPGGLRLALLVLGSGVLWILVAAGVVGWHPLLWVPVALLAVSTACLAVARRQLVLVLFGVWAALIVTTTVTFASLQDVTNPLEVIPYALIVVVPFSTLVLALVVGPPLLLESRLRRTALG